MAGALRPILAPVLAPVLVFSAVFNVLLLSGSFFMLLVYDDVLASRSGATLAGLLLMVAVAYVFQGALDVVRSRVLLHSGAQADRRLCDRLFDVVSRYEQESGPLPPGAAPVRDLDLVRTYITGPGPLALLDLPYVLLFLLILTLFHWALALVTLAGVAVMVALMVIGDQRTRAPALQAALIGARRMAMAEDIRRNAEVLRVLGMSASRRAGWDAASLDLIAAHDELAEVSSGTQVIGKAFRLFLQSLVLAIGAFLVIDGDATGGIIVAGSILSARALMPVEQAIGQWKAMTEAGQAWRRLSDLVARLPRREALLPLPRPQATLEAQGLVCGPPGQQKVTLANVSFRLAAGEVLAVIGHSGSGKSSLARAITGAWPLLRGAVRLDGASLEQWDPVALGRDIGYVPQAIELLEGTVAQNIARFDPDASPGTIIAAARAADVHDMIVKLPGGYAYPLGGPAGGGLSGGQKQRLALARALYGDPFLIVLDEPNSNLDADGDKALLVALTAARARGAAVVIVGHRPAVLARADHVLVMAGGQAAHFGPRAEILQRIGFGSAKDGGPLRPRSQPPETLGSEHGA
jgi:ATP-binding cassette subfamily C protein